MCLVLAADSFQRAVDERRRLSLVWAGVWVGLGFEVKMLEAWMILPAFVLAYLVAALRRPAPPASADGTTTALRRRFSDLGVGGVVTFVVSFLWIALDQLVPAAGRPFIDGSTNNSALSMVFGYNGLGRLGIHLAGALTPVQAGIPGADGWDKLFNHRVGPEIAWLDPLVLLGLAGAVALWARKERGPSAAGFVMWLAWLLDDRARGLQRHGALRHTAYLGALAPPIAALSATGITLAWRWRGEPSWRSLLLPLAIAGELTWSYYLWDSYDSFLHPILWAAVALAGLALVMIAIARLHPQLGSRVLTSGAAVGIVAMLAAPAAWSASVLDPRYGGQPYDATAGPAGSYGVTRGLDISAVPSGLERLYDYLAAHQNNAAYLMAAQSWYVAAPYVVTTGREMLPMGGYTGQAPTPTLAGLQHLVRTGQVRYVMLEPNLSGGPQNGAFAISRDQLAIGRWVQHTCAPVPPNAYGSPDVENLGSFSIFIGPLYNAASRRWQRADPAAQVLGFAQRTTLARRPAAGAGLERVEHPGGPTDARRWLPRHSKGARGLGR